jgi:uncharacterized RDD family membrane protein YckC
MKARFQPDAEARVPDEPLWIDPEAYDASEQQFAASFEETGARFVLEADAGAGHPVGIGIGMKTKPIAQRPQAGDRGEASAPVPESNPARVDFSPAEHPPSDRSEREPSPGELSPDNPSPGNPFELDSAPKHPAPPASDQADASAHEAPGSGLRAPAHPVASEDPDRWREEVAARLNKYRARRRPREPRYPSLRLKFEPGEPLCSSPPPLGDRSPSQPATRGATAVEPARAVPVRAEASEKPVAHALEVSASPPDGCARIIPFPRSATAPPTPLEELAEPVPDRPRILEVPEVAPPAPALGGILIEPPDEPMENRRPGFEVPLQCAPRLPRLLAATTDGVLVLLATAIFGWIFFQITATVPPLRQLMVLVLCGLGMAWIGYQYLLLVYAGTTPGLGIAGLRLSRFDGSRVPRRIRRWRVLASVLSGFSFGLGYAWCVLDEDQLSWHDRITRTYLAPRTRVPHSHPAD